MKPRYSLVLLLAIPLPVSAQAARDTARIAATVVTATRSPLATTLSPASVSVISGAALREQGIVTVVDALKQVPGLSVVQTGSYGGATSVFIRGGESKFAKVLVDGVPVNDAGGSFDFSNLSTDNLDRIEIVRGPASVLYGSDAMAGVIQLFTRTGRGAPKVDATVRGGEFNTYDGDASLRGANGAFSYSVGGARHSTDGIQLFNSQYRQTVGSMLLGARSGAFDATLNARYSDNNLHYPTDGAGQVVDSNATRRDDRISAGFDGGYRVSPLVEMRLSLSSWNVHGITDDQPDSKGDNAGYYYTTGDRSYRRSGDVRVNIGDENYRVTLGAQVEREWQASSTESNFGPNAFTARRRTSGGYAQLLVMPATTSTVTVGGRLEHNETFGDFFTYRAAGTTELVQGTRVRGSLGTSFREPTFLENFGSAFVIGNPALAPEHAMSFDAAIEQDVGHDATIIATWFTNSFRDLIDYKYSATAPNYNNIARTKTSGIELEGKLTLPEGFRADAAFTYLSAKVVDPGVNTANNGTFAPGANLLRRPAHTLDAGVGYRMGRGGLDLRAHHVGVREDVFYPADFSAAKRLSLSPYTRFDLSGDVTLVHDAARTVGATLRVENLLNENYMDLAGVNFDFSKTDAASVNASGYRAAPRRALVGMRLSF